MEFKGVLLDFGGTIAKESNFDYLKGIKAVLQYCTNNYNNVTEYDLYNLSNFIDTQIGRKNGYIKLSGDLEYPEFILKNYIFDYYNLSFSVNKHELEYIFWKEATDIFKLCDIEKSLKLLIKNNIKIGILSNISFSKYALEKRINDIFNDIKFDCIITSADYGFRKPNQLIFKLATKMLNLNADEILFIGDDYVNDIKGSLDFGMKSIFLSENKDYIKDSYIGKYNIFNSWNHIYDYFKGEKIYE